jgi:hypothetical protein
MLGLPSELLMKFTQGLNCVTGVLKLNISQIQLGGTAVKMLGRQALRASLCHAIYVVAAIRTMSVAIQQQHGFLVF